MPYVEKLKTIKEEKDLTNAEIAKLSNIPLPTITRVFNGQTPNPTFETISRIASALGVSLDEISGLKQPDEQPIASPIVTTLNSYSELLAEKDKRITELKDTLERVRNEKRTFLVVLIGLIAFILVFLAINLFGVLSQIE